jgi:hypothetical protein
MDATSDIRLRRRGPKLPELALTDKERATLGRPAQLEPGAGRTLPDRADLRRGGKQRDPLVVR